MTPKLSEGGRRKGSARRRLWWLAGALAMIIPTESLGWTRTYVVEWHDLAFLYGGPADGNGDTPGSDCPGGANPANDWKRILKTSWRTDGEVSEILSPEFNHSEMYRQFALRGPKREDILINPTAVPDPGMTLVGGKVAQGFNLDGDNRTGGFVSPTGETGVDNAFYRVAGCIAGMRGPPRTAMWQKQQNDGMHDGEFTVVFVLSGNAADPRNDDDATFGIYLARDPMVKDANGAMARDYSYRIDPDPRFQTVAKVRIRDGVVETREPTELRMRDFPTPKTSPKELRLYKGQLRFEMKPDGGLTGLVGGYRDWMDFYKGQNGNGQTILGTIHENLWHMSMPAFYYALKRNADAMPDPKTGQNTAISVAYRIDAIPAFVIAPDSAAPVQVARAY